MSRFGFGRMRLVVLGATLAIALGLAASASADVVVKGGYATVGDCQVVAYLDFSNAGGVYANGTATCSARHASTEVLVTLKRDGASFAWNGTTFTNSFGLGSRSVSTSAYAPAGHCWQAVTQAAISGLPLAYSTSRSPVCF